MNPRNPSPIVATKIHPPWLSGSPVDRPRVLRRFEEAWPRRVTVLKAPPGFGKTTLALMWLEKLRERGERVGWVSIDPEDNEPHRFLHYLAAALDVASGGALTSFLSLLRESSLIEPQSLVTHLINALADFEESLTLFLDDYHYLTHPAIQDAMSLLLQHAPRSMRFVLVARSEVPLPLARLRVLNHLLEIDVEDMRLTIDEMDCFCKNSWRVSLSEQDLRSLHATTEGWAAGLHIVGLKLHGRENVASAVRAMSGVTRPIGAYLSDVLATLPAETVKFLLHTSILDRLTAPLCQAVTGCVEPQRQLEQLSEQQLFLIPLDADRHWFRYHQLFSEYLRSRLASEAPDEVAGLHRKACHWFAAEGRWADAVKHALAINDFELAARWVEESAVLLLRDSDLATLIAWEKSLPRGMLVGRLRVQLAIAWGLALGMRGDESMNCVAEIEADLSSYHARSTETIRRQCLTIRALVAALSDDSVTALRLASFGAGAVWEEDLWLTNALRNILRFGYLHSGEPDRVLAIPFLPYVHEDGRRDLLEIAYRHGLQGLARERRAQLREAETLYCEALAIIEPIGGRFTTAATQAASHLAGICYEFGRLDEVEDLLIDRLEIITTTNQIDPLISALLSLTRTAAARGASERAYSLLEEAESLGVARNWPRLTAFALLEWVRLDILDNRLMHANACIKRLEALVQENPAPTRCALTDIRIAADMARAYGMVAQQRHRDALDVLGPLIVEAEREDHCRWVRLTCLQALALAGEGELGQARERLQEAASLGATAGMYRTFVDAGPEIGPILQQLRDALVGKPRGGHLLQYVERLLAGWHAQWRDDLLPAGESAEVGVLSQRERAIITKIAEGRSNKEIARLLGIAPETVKWHVKNIYAKLEVGKRAQAIVRAQSLGLLD